MEDNLPWKLVYFGAIFSLLVLGFAYYLISPHQAPDGREERNERIAEFKNARLEGRKGGKRSWEFFAREGWTSKDQNTTYLSWVKNGEIYKDGKLLVSSLSSPRVIVYRQADVVEAFGQAEKVFGLSKLSAYIDLGKVAAKPGQPGAWTKIIADHIKYSAADKKTSLAGNVSLIKKTTRINAAAVEIDHEKQAARITGDVKLRRPNLAMSAEALEYLGAEEQFNAAGKVNLKIRAEKIRTFIACDRGTFYADENKDMNLYGSLEVVQGSKIAIAREGIYAKQKNGLLLRGGTRTILRKGAAILREETVKKLDNPDVKDVLKQLTVVQANEMFFSTRTGDAKATGSVEVTQLGREARADSAVYNDKQELLTLTGNVYMKKGEEWLNCRQVIVSVRKETFEAQKVTEAKFKL